MQDLRKIIDHFIKGMASVNKERLKTAQKELSLCMTENKYFNELCQKINLIDQENIQEYPDGIPKD